MESTKKVKLPRKRKKEWKKYHKIFGTWYWCEVLLIELLREEGRNPKAKFFKYKKIRNHYKIIGSF